MSAALLALMWLLPSVDEFVLLAQRRLCKDTFAVGAGIVAGTFMDSAHMQVEITGAVAHLGADATAVCALQRVIVEVNLQLRPGGLLHATVGASVVLDARMAHHVHLQQLLAGETSPALRILTHVRQLGLVLVGEAMILQTPHGVEGLATVFTHMRLGLLAQFVALAHVHRQCILVTVSTITSLLGTGIWHTSMLAFVCLQSVLLQELCGADVALVNAGSLRKKGLIRFKA